MIPQGTSRKEGESEASVKNIPCKDVLRMVVAEVDLGDSTDRDTAGLVVVVGHDIRDCHTSAPSIVIGKDQPRP